MAPGSLGAMGTVVQVVKRLHDDARSGALAGLCDPLGIDLVVLFGSAVTDPSTAGDVDLAYGRRHGAAVDHLDVVNAMGERYGDHLDVLDLDAAGSVARFAALHGVDVLLESTPARYANAQIRAHRDFCDTQRLRDAALEALAR